MTSIREECINVSSSMSLRSHVGNLAIGVVCRSKESFSIYCLGRAFTILYSIFSRSVFKESWWLVWTCFLWVLFWRYFPCTVFIVFCHIGVSVSYLKCPVIDMKYISEGFSYKCSPQRVFLNRIFVTFCSLGKIIWPTVATEYIRSLYLMHTVSKKPSYTVVKNIGGLRSLRRT